MSIARRQGGFSLIELAVVLVIIGLLIGGGIVALDATMEQTRRADQRRQLEHVRDALYGFAMSRGRLPCADTDDDGEENYGDPECESGAERGALPWVTLGVGRRDAWGNPLYYAVTARPTGSTVEDYADAPPTTDGSTFALDDGKRANLNVYDDEPGAGGDLIAEYVPAVVVSFGPQGDQVWTATGRECPGAGAGFFAAEQDNCDDDTSFVDAGYRTSGDPEGRFDDMLTWLPDPVLKARMVEAGRLP